MNKKRYKTPMAKFHELAINGTMITVDSGERGTLNNQRNGSYQENQDDVSSVTWGHQF